MTTSARDGAARKRPAATHVILRWSEVRWPLARLYDCRRDFWMLSIEVSSCERQRGKRDCQSVSSCSGCALQISAAQVPLRRTNLVKALDDLDNLAVGRPPPAVPLPASLTARREQVLLERPVIDARVGLELGCVVAEERPQRVKQLRDGCREERVCFRQALGKGEEGVERARLSGPRAKSIEAQRSGRLSGRARDDRGGGEERISTD